MPQPVKLRILEGDRPALSADPARVAIAPPIKDTYSRRHVLLHRGTAR
jgi:hypothetical protein